MYVKGTLGEVSEGILSLAEIDYRVSTYDHESEKIDDIEKQTVLETLEKLMKIAEIGFYFEKVTEKYSDDLTVECYMKLLNRCRKLYAAIHSLTTVFKLLQRERTDSV